MCVKRLLLQIKNDLETIAAASSTWKHDDLSDLEILIILLEDRRFFQHSGFDALSIVREIFRLFTFQKHGGASTIDMQFVRTRTGYKDRTLKRKVYEIVLAYLLQSKMDKIQILRAYLQQMYLGSGIYGIERGAEVMFGKPSYELDKKQAAVLAAMMVYPKPLHPTPAWDARIRQRAQYGLRLFEKLAFQYKRRME